MLPDWVRLGRRLGRLLRDRHHPDQRDALLERLRQQVLASVALREERRLHAPRASYPPDLPITARKDEIVAAIRDGDSERAALAAETHVMRVRDLVARALEASGIPARA